MVRAAAWLLLFALVALAILIVAAWLTDLSWVWPRRALLVAAILVLVIVGYTQTLKRSTTLYRATIDRGLDRAYTGPRVYEETVGIGALRLIIFSDQHKGTRDGADDFWRSERAYNGALAYYERLGHRLVVLGDAEELWENAPKAVLEKHGFALDLEARYHAAGRYLRVYGNHDIDWEKPAKVRDLLHRRFPGLTVHEAIRLTVTRPGKEAGTLFLAHGHQGTADSELLAAISRPAVTLFGLAQRRFKRGWNTPATDWGLRNRHDSAMFEWAKKKAAQCVVLITGHTHRPVFWDRTPKVPTSERVEQLRTQLAERKAAGAPAEELAGIEAAIEWTLAEQRWKPNPPDPVDPPCYFNTGCCSFSDGDVTGLEIADGEIRLVRFPNDDYEPRPKVLESAPLEDVFAAFAAS